MYKVNKILYGAAFMVCSISQLIASSTSYDYQAFTSAGRFSNYYVKNSQMQWEADSVDTTDAQHTIIINFLNQYPDQVNNLLPSSIEGQDPVQLYQKQNMNQEYFDSAIVKNSTTSQYIGLVDMRYILLSSYSSNIQQQISEFNLLNPSVLQVCFIGNQDFNKIYSTDIWNGLQDYFKTIYMLNNAQSTYFSVPASTNEPVIPDVIVSYLNPDGLSPLPDPLVISLNM